MPRSGTVVSYDSPGASQLALSGKESTCQCRRHKRCESDPWVGKIPWRRAWQPAPAFLPGESPWTEEWIKKICYTRFLFQKKESYDNLRNLWDNIKHTNICIIGVWKKDREKGAENLFEEIVTENVPNLVKETDTQVQEAERPIKDEPKETHAKIHYF